MIKLYNPEYFNIVDRGTTQNGDSTTYVADICGECNTKSPGPSNFIVCRLFLNNEPQFNKYDDTDTDKSWTKIKGSIKPDSRDVNKDVMRIKITSCPAKYDEQIIILAIPFEGSLLDIDSRGATLMKVAVKPAKRGKGTKFDARAKVKICFVAARVMSGKDSAAVTLKTKYTVKQNTYVEDEITVGYNTHDETFLKTYNVSEFIHETPDSKKQKSLDLGALADSIMQECKEENMANSIPYSKNKTRKSK